MKEFVEKLIGRLENRIKYNELCHKEFPNAKMSFTYEVQINAYKNVIEIVNQLAEEYGKDTNVTTNNIEDGYYYIENGVVKREDGYTGSIEKIGRVVSLNNGWIPCSERLPETYEYVLVWCKGRFIDGTHVGEECEWYGIGVMYGKKWTVYQCKDIRDIEVLAWMLLPAQYQKGE